MVSISSAFSALAGIFSAKYYVTQQLTQMQAHYLNRDHIIKHTIGPSKRVVSRIFNDYEKEIEVDKWCWIKKDGELHVIPMNNGYVRNKHVKICENQRFNGIFPPIAAIASAMDECGTRLDIQNGWMSEAKGRMKHWMSAYVSNLEYWVLQLEAIEQDMSLE